MKDSTFITRVVLKNYKSIAACQVKLRPLTFLVGPNGAGKSNFLDALRFVTDALRHSLDHALRDRGGINEVRRRSGGHPNHFGIGLNFTLRSGENGYYAFRIGARPGGGYEVQQEECIVREPESLSDKAYFRVESGKVMTNLSITPPAAARDRLYLVNASGLAEFRPVYEAFSSMGFYHLNPAQIRDLMPPDPGELLMRDGSNLASVLDKLDKPVKERIEEYLAKVVPGVRGVSIKRIGPKDTLEFRQGVAGAKHPWRFLAINMSDGTLRVLGILVALFQGTPNGMPPVPLVGIEEPEIALHPAAAGILLDALIDASQRTQILVTSHSPDLLDNKDLRAESILAVIAESGTTQIGSLDDVGRSVLNDRLYTVGELLRLNQLEPDQEVISKTPSKQLRLFEGSTLSERF